jgi:class 3 adenylate cyclase
MSISPPDATEPSERRRRRLRAVLAADVANFGGLVSVDETSTLDSLWTTRRVAREELAIHGGWLFGMPGDGIFALFESAVDAVRCALSIQSRLSAMPKLNAMRLRVGVNLGEVLFQDDLPFGEALVIAARLESLAEPGGILISAAVMEAVAPRISASFTEKGVFNLKHSPRRITTYSVAGPPSSAGGLNETAGGPFEALDRTVASVRPGRVRPAPEPELPPRLEPELAPERELEREPEPVPALASVEAHVATLPKATQLVVASPVAAPETPPTSVARGDKGLLQDCLAELTAALTVHIGPVAPVIVRQHAAGHSDPIQLIEALAQEIPAGAERPQFLMRANQVIDQKRR